MPLDRLPFRGGANFLGLPPEDCTYEEARAVLLPVPYDSTTSYRAGTRDGPAAILAASRNVELFDPEFGCEPLNRGVHTLPELEPDMRGPQATVATVEEAVRTLLVDGKFPFLLGGEHSLTTGPIRALHAIHGDDLCVLQLDAHADLRDSYEHTPYNHASVMRRAIELIGPDRLTQVGIRNISAGEMAFVQKTKHDGIFWAHDIAAGDPAHPWIDRVLERLTKRVYITIDLDAFDPSVMPAVGTPEPGGLHWYPVLHLLRQVVAQREVVGCDVVELCPIPGFIAPDFFAAKLVFKLLAFVFARQGWLPGRRRFTATQPQKERLSAAQQEGRRRAAAAAPKTKKSEKPVAGAGSRGRASGARSPTSARAARPSSPRPPRR